MFVYVASGFLNKSRASFFSRYVSLQLIEFEQIVTIYNEFLLKSPGYEYSYFLRGRP